VASHEGPGPVIAIGGGEDREDPHGVLARLVALAGGPRARIAVLPTASGSPNGVGRAYVRAFVSHGAPEPVVLPFVHGSDTRDERQLERLATATLVFFTGGDQQRLAGRLGGTRVVEVLEQLRARGVPIAGTSAGAAVLSARMIARGSAAQATSRASVLLEDGFGFAPDVVVDQHFSQRGRMARLVAAVAQHPRLVGIGVDEDTAAVVEDGVVEVLGSGSVTVVDGRGLIHTDIDRVGAHAPAAVLGLAVHVLTAGCRFHLAAAKASPPSE
jgi:cyanophycinase